MTEENRKFIEYYKKITKDKFVEEIANQAKMDKEKRKAKAEAAKEERYEKYGKKGRGNDRTDLWLLVGKKSDELVGASAAAFNDFRQSMNEIWQACMLFSEALSYSYSEFARATVGSFALWSFHTVKDGLTMRIKVSFSNPDLPELQYKVSLEDGKGIQASFEKGEGLSDPQLKALFIADVETWLKEVKGYSKKPDGKYVNGATELTNTLFDELRADKTDTGLENWLKKRYKEVTINLAPEDDAAPDDEPRPSPSV